MTSQSSTSSLAKHRQSWLDLVSQASPSVGETVAVVCSAQVHSRQPPEEEPDEVDVAQVLESTSQQDSPEVDSGEESPVAEEDEAHTAVPDAQEEEGDNVFYFFNQVCFSTSCTERIDLHFQVTCLQL